MKVNPIWISFVDYENLLSLAQKKNSVKHQKSLHFRYRLHRLLVSIYVMNKINI